MANYSTDSIMQKVISHKATLDSNRKDIRDNKILIKEKSDKLTNLNELNRITDWSCNYLDTLIKEESGKFIQRLNELLNYGVKTIFYDCNYTVEIRVSENNKATIHLVYDDENGIKLDPDIQNCGGGIKSVIGTMLQIYFIFYYHVEPILFVDEGFSQISTQYLPNFFGLLRELAVKNGMRVVLITHDDRFLGYADRSYEIENGKAVLKSEGVNVDDSSTVKGE